MESKKCLIGGGSKDFVCTVPLDVKAADWKAASRCASSPIGRADDRPARREPAVLLAVGAVLLVLSGIGPKDLYTWILEVVAGRDRRRSSSSRRTGAFR